MSDILAQLSLHRLIPVIALDRAEDAGPLADALITGGLPVAEVTFRTAAAEASIREMSKRSNMLVVSYCVSNKIPVTPGCVTPTEIQMALEHGINTVKFFPAEAVGGIKTLKAFAAPFAQVKFIPTGGITEKNLADYLSFAPVIACGGSWMVTKELLAGREFSKITSITAAAVAMAKK
jgi:2-dehydro-3-deoxyphosphogluconate aldolase/(4S)-4-hydroxy-2-oxoglutarate aldolase